MSIYEMTIKTETANGESRVEHVTVYGADAVVAERTHYRSMAPQGATRTIEVKTAGR